MKKLLLIFLCLPMIGFGQLTYVPDDNFEAYLESNGLGNGIFNDDYVFTSSIDTLTTLNLYISSISDMTGIEYFINLTYLDVAVNNFTTINISSNINLTYLNCDYNNLTNLDVNTNVLLEELVCSSNQLTNLDVSSNVLLEELDCSLNQLTNLDVSTNTSLKELYCFFNNLTSLNVNANTDLIYLECMYNNLINLNLSTNTSLEELYCFNNNLTNLDVSNNVLLVDLGCGDNQLTSLDVRNGNNSNFGWLDCTNNPNLICIDVDNAAWSTANWTVANQNIDPQHYFSTNCSGTSVEEHTTNKALLKVTDILGRKTKGTKSELLFYIYDDGKVEKRIVIE